MICFSGITDCYQPAERNFQLTRQCLQVAAEARQPIGIITKNRLVTRDLDVLAPMAEQSLVHVSLSITTLDEKLARRMEPRTSRPSARLEAIRELARAGVPTRVMIAPVIPGLNDSEIPQILKAAKEAGAGAAGHVLLRLSGSVRPVFLEWLSRSEPTHAARVEAAIRQTRAGKLNDTQFGAACAAPERERSRSTRRSRPLRSDTVSTARFCRLIFHSSGRHAAPEDSCGCSSPTAGSTRRVAALVSETEKSARRVSRPPQKLVLLARMWEPFGEMLIARAMIWDLFATGFASALQPTERISR